MEYSLVLSIQIDHDVQAPGAVVPDFSVNKLSGPLGDCSREPITLAIGFRPLNRVFQKPLSFAQVANLYSMAVILTAMMNTASPKHSVANAGH